MLVKSEPLDLINTYPTVAEKILEISNKYHVGIRVIGSLNQPDPRMMVEVLGEEQDVIKCIAEEWGNDGHDAAYLFGAMLIGNPVAKVLWNADITDSEVHTVALFMAKCDPNEAVLNEMIRLHHLMEGSE